MSNKPKKGAKVKESKSGEVSKLKQKISHLRKDNKILREKLKTLERAHKSSESYINMNLQGIPVEQVLHNLKQKVATKNDSCSQCGSSNVSKITTIFGHIISCKEDDCNYQDLIRDKK